jgi:hypothetical protein
MDYVPTDWHVYRTRFLVRARQLTEATLFVDALGREHQGDVGDYLVESSDGSCRIARREIFEDIYVAMAPADDNVWPSLAIAKPLPPFPEPVSQAGLRTTARSLFRTAGSAFS